MRLSRRVYLVIFAVFFLIAVGVIFMIPRSNKVTVYSDISPVKLEIGDNTYRMNSKKLSVSLDGNLYQYRATATIDGKPMVLQGKISFANTRKQIIRLNYSLYSNASVTNALCEAFSGSCPFEPQDISVTYFENHQWAVVSINSPRFGKAKAVLQTVNGRWEVNDGPATDIETGGYYPDSVEEALNNV